jgi:hypothetical protein
MFDGTFLFPDGSGDLRGAVLRGAATIFLFEALGHREGDRVDRDGISIDHNFNSWTGDHSDIGLVDWYVWRTAPVLPYPVESTGTWLPYAQDDAVNFKKVA